MTSIHKTFVGPDGATYKRHAALSPRFRVNDTFIAAYYNGAIVRAEYVGGAMPASPQDWGPYSSTQADEWIREAKAAGLK